ncbi:MAG TPA: alpha/beta hydrolase [Anaerolineae bacterium]|nr:alpha/beta hydrolase [Anaerolineae bacterium]
MSITTVEEHLIHYEVLGRGQPLIFIHGWLGSWRYWWPSMQELARGHRTFAFDLWGYGNSSKVQSKYSFESYVSMVGQLMDKLGIMQPVILVGHSLGAAVALRFATTHPDRVKRIAGVSMPVHGTQIHSRLANSDTSVFINRVLGKGNSFNEIDSEIPKSDRAAVNVLAKQLRDFSFVDDLQKCTCPIMLIAGSQDPVIQTSNGEIESLVQGQNRYYVTLEGGSHFPMLQEPAKFNRLLLDFIHSDGDQTKITPKVLWQRRNR